MNGGASANTSDSNGNYSLSNSATVTFNGATTTNSGVTFNATFGTAASGTISGTAAVPGTSGLFTGETLASGSATPVLPTTLNVPYTATVLQPRNLVAVSGGNLGQLPSAAGGLLYGAVVSVPSGYAVTSTNANADDNHATRVYVTGTATAVASDGVTPVGQVTVTQQTLVNGAGNFTVPLTIEADSVGPVSGSASVGVATAETAFQDNTVYAPVNVSYTISNVGWAATGGPNPSNPNQQLFGAPLSATFATGAALSRRTARRLTSVVGVAGASGSNSTATDQTTAP